MLPEAVEWPPIGETPMAISTVTEAIEAAVAMEESVRSIYLSFEEKFRETRGAPRFFAKLAADEADHARLWAEIGSQLPASRLAEKPSDPLLASIQAAQALLAGDPTAGVDSFPDALDLTRRMENAELLAVFRVLAIELVPDGKRREFLYLQID